MTWSIKSHQHGTVTAGGTNNVPLSGPPAVAANDLLVGVAYAIRGDNGGFLVGSVNTPAGYTDIIDQARQHTFFKVAAGGETVMSFVENTGIGRVNIDAYVLTSDSAQLPDTGTWGGQGTSGGTGATVTPSWSTGCTTTAQGLGLVFLTAGLPPSIVTVVGNNSDWFEADTEGNYTSLWIGNIPSAQTSHLTLSGSGFAGFSEDYELTAFHIDTVVYTDGPKANRAEVRRLVDVTELPYAVMTGMDWPEIGGESGIR